MGRPQSVQNPRPMCSVSHTPRRSGSPPGHIDARLMSVLVYAQALRRQPDAMARVVAVSGPRAGGGVARSGFEAMRSDGMTVVPVRAESSRCHSETVWAELRAACAGDPQRLGAIPASAGQPEPCDSAHGYTKRAEAAREEVCEFCRPAPTRERIVL